MFPHRADRDSQDLQFMTTFTRQTEPRQQVQFESVKAESFGWTPFPPSDQRPLAPHLLRGRGWLLCLLFAQCEREVWKWQLCWLKSSDDTFHFAPGIRQSPLQIPTLEKLEPAHAEAALFFFSPLNQTVVVVALWSMLCVYASGRVRNPLFLSMCAFDSGRHCESELSVTKPLTCQHCRGRVCPTDGLKEQQSGHRVAVASARMHGRPEPTSRYQSFSGPSDWLTYWPPLQCRPFIFNCCVCRDGWDQDCGSLWWS